ncbi:MAG: FAD-dependent oxidoreductase [Oscillospiraceae bacterium]|jgi:2,4-dienoyl-CoA reductase-like NADH-dependent reductase (Old Yellow Enzyme family)/thioredoxin reductase
MNQYYPKLFEPITIKGVTFRNRIWSAPNMMCHMDAAGFPTEYMIAYYAEKARGGAAVVTLGDTPVDREHAATNPRSFNLSYESLPFLSEIAMAIHEYGAKASHELNHGGMVAVPEANNGNEPIGPVDMVREDGVRVRAMTEEDMEIIADRFAEAAWLLKTAGYDMCLIHGGHGWLLGQFLSPLYNRRTDEYGGSLENRARFPIMVIDRVRQKVGPDFLIEYRFSCSEEIEGGLTKEEGIAFAKMIDDKVDILHVSCGLDIEDAQAVRLHPTMFLPHGVNVHYAQAVKAAGVKSPVIAVGAISDPEMAEEILESGKADIVAMARALIADPEFPEKARTGRAKEIRPCLRCLDCLTGMHTGQHFQCSVNPRTGREFRYRNYIQPAREKKRVLVVGGGPGGMMAAMTAAERGHEVTLAEKNGSLGGLLKFTDHDDLKIDLRRLKDWLIHMTYKSGATVLLNAQVTPEFAKSGGYDAIIVAAGSSPLVPPIPGLTDPKVIHALQIYDSTEELGKNIALLGGGLVGCETALYLAGRGHSVTIVEMMDQLAPEANWMHREGMMQAFAGADITQRTGLKVCRVEPNRVTAVDRDGGQHLIECDSVVYAFGMRGNAEVFDALRDCAPTVVAVGDCVKARKTTQAIHEGFWAAVNLA